MIDQTCQQFEAIDILHNNVGLSVAGGDKPVLEIEAEDFDFLFRLNLRAMVLAAKHALPGMRARRRGSDHQYLVGCCDGNLSLGGLQDFQRLVFWR